MTISLLVCLLVTLLKHRTCHKIARYISFSYCTKFLGKVVVIKYFSLCCLLSIFIQYNYTNKHFKRLIQILLKMAHYLLKTSH